MDLRLVKGLAFNSPAGHCAFALPFIKRGNVSGIESSSSSSSDGGNDPAIEEMGAVRMGPRKIRFGKRGPSRIRDKQQSEVKARANKCERRRRCCERRQRGTTRDHRRLRRDTEQRPPLSSYVICKTLPPPGPGVYDVYAEYSRLGFLSMPGICLLWQSKEYEICSTYPRGLIINHESDISDIKVCASFRSRSRLPVACWVHPRTRAVLGRSRPAAARTAQHPFESRREARWEIDAGGRDLLPATTNDNSTSGLPKFAPSRRAESERSHPSPPAVAAKDPSSDADGDSDTTDASPTNFAAGAWNSFTTWASSSGLVPKKWRDRGA